MPNQFAEIERKYLLTSFSTDLPLKRQFEVYQAYLSIDPEVRIRRNVVSGKDVAYFLAVKSSGSMVRHEVEMYIRAEHFYALADMVPQRFIKKNFRIYELPNGLELECSQVDEGWDTEFIYAEVEFPSVEEAESFTPSFEFEKEITDDPAYKMKNYWKRTRLYSES